MNKAIATVAAETGVTVPLLRVLAHAHLESGGTGDPKTISIGTNTCCPRPGIDCSPGPDCRAMGIMQIFWPPFGGVKWDKILDLDYNVYIGTKVLAYRYKECGDWDGASVAFFSGGCDKNGATCDASTGVCVSEYLTGIHQRMRELAQIGIDNTSGGGLPPTSDPGTGSTPSDGSNCIGPVCLPEIDTSNIVMQTILSKLQGSVFPVGLLLIGLVLVIIGIVKVL